MLDLSLIGAIHKIYKNVPNEVLVYYMLLLQCPETHWTKIENIAPLWELFSLQATSLMNFHT